VGRASVLSWTQRLTGLEIERSREGLQRVRSWRIPHVTAELVERDDIDSVVGAVLLAEGVVDLTAHGVPETKLLSKLRGDREVWPTWAEIRAADILLRTIPDDVSLTMEAGRARGRHADFRLVGRESGHLATSVEFKALGLSDLEVEFYKRSEPVLNQMCPRLGTAHLHAQIEQPLEGPSPVQKREGERWLRDARRQLPRHARNLTGAAVVGHAGEALYLERLRRRLIEAFAQLPASDECWVAFYWSNGAPHRVVAQVLETIELPGHVAGIILLGAAVVILDSQIHIYSSAIEPGSRDAEELTVRSLDDHPLAAPVLEVFQSSSGIRPTLLVDPESPRRSPVLKRTGDRRILPFNLLLDKDPPEARLDPREGHRVVAMDSRLPTH
jgi:hypothetical protein